MNIILTAFRKDFKTEEEALNSWKNNEVWLWNKSNGVEEVTRDKLIREQGNYVYVELRFNNITKSCKTLI